MLEGTMLGMKQSEFTSGMLYKSLLEERCSSVSWARGDDPPDFVFTCDEVGHAVEVTELHQYLDVQGKEMSRAHDDEAIEDICESCEKELGPALHRTVSVVVSSPLGKGELQSLRDMILSYVREDKEETEWLFVRDDCWLESWVEDEPTIGAAVIPAAHSCIPGSRTLSINVQASTDYALDRILSAKLPRLKAFSQFPERVLIIYPRDPRCSRKHVQCSIRRYEQERKVLVRDTLTKVYFVRRFRDLLNDPSHSQRPSLEEVVW